MKYVSHGLLLSWGLLTNRLIEKIKKKSKLSLVVYWFIYNYNLLVQTILYFPWLGNTLTLAAKKTEHLKSVFKQCQFFKVIGKTRRKETSAICSFFSLFPPNINLPSPWQAASRTPSHRNVKGEWKWEWIPLEMSLRK